MRSMMIVALGLVLSPLFAYANCPQLAGTYSCRYGIFSKRVTVTQMNRGGSIVYQVDNGGDIIADGIRHQTPNLHPMLDKHARNYSYIANCGTNRLDFQGIADLVRGGQGDVEGELVKTGSNLQIRLHLVTPDSDKEYNLSCTP